MIKIKVRQGNIAEEKTEAIVCPANSHGLMGGGVAKAIKMVGGPMIEVEAIRKAPIRIGEAIMTDGAMLPAKYVIHSPTMELPVSASTKQDIIEAVRAALRIAEQNKLSKISMPGMGTGVGGFEPIDAARIMIDEIRGFDAGSLKEVTLVDISELMVKAFRDALVESK